MNKIDYKQGDLFDAQIIPLHLAINAMRDSGYKNTAYALAELIDNSVQAEASTVLVIAIEKRQLVSQRELQRLYKIGVMDNGTGMDAKTLRMALQFGNGTRLDNREGIGRFGMGLPNSSISQASRVDVWTWQNGPDNAIRTFIDLNMINKGEMNEVPNPELDPLPQEWRAFSDYIGNSGTLVVWSDLCMERLTWKRAKPTFEHTEWLVGRIHRYFIMDNSVEIHLISRDGDSGEKLIDRRVSPNDPLYLNVSPTVPAPFNEIPMFKEAISDQYEIEYENKKYNVDVLFSVATQETVLQANGPDRGKTLYGKHAQKNMGLSVLRANREIMLDPGWCHGYDPRDRWWGAQVNFPPALDELFGVTNNKQNATHFSELSSVDWEQFAEEGETFHAVVERLKGEGDPRGWLLALSNSIKRNILELRKTIIGQTAGKRSSRKRHGDADDATKTANKGWEKRSKTIPLKGEAEKLTDQNIKDIRNDLIKNKKYSEIDADEIVSLIKSKDLKVYFGEAPFPDDYNLFTVEVKGNRTAIIVNRNHPAFDDIFATAATGEEDIGDLSPEELADHLTRAVNSTKILLAAWARYEREAGVDSISLIRKIRFDWGQIAASFLQK